MPSGAVHDDHSTETTIMNVVREIATWAKKLSSWQGDALRRIFTSDNLSASDEEEILAMLLVSHNVPDDNTVAPTPLPFSDVAQEAAAPSRRVLLRELHSLSGVNAIVPGQSLKFALDGLTIVYGENGAGKSGYARVLKHACHAREKSEQILPDVTQQKKVTPCAIIEVSVDDEDVALQWKAKSRPSEVLSEIAVFDAHCARVFLDEANEVVYLPYGLDVFGKLAALCKSLKDKIATRLAQIPAALPFAADFKQTTSAGRFVSSLSANSDLNQLTLLSQLDALQIARLEELRRLVAATKGDPPRQRAAQLRRIKSRFDQLANKAKTISEALSSAILLNLKSLKQQADTAAKAAHLASTQAFAKDPIPATGSDPWQNLFDAAKAFSEHAVYPEEEFPVTREGAVCVLCQQPLSDFAAERLQRFKRFVLDDAAKKKADADLSLRKAIEPLSSLACDYLKNDKTLLDELRAHNDNLAASAERFFAAASTRKQALLQAVAAGQWETVPEMPTSVVADLTAAAATLEASAKEFDKADKPDELLKLQVELAELEDRERLGKHADEIRAFVAAKRREANLRDCDRALDTTAITRFGSELMEKAVTEQLTTALGNELEFFDIHSVPLNVRKSGEKGKTKHQLTIQTGARPSGVLSEGEQRVVAIACFLAELSTSPAKSPIVFDDPVSSLDHLFRERVAKRLVTEAKHRQLVVFTHDIVMLLSLEKECAEQRVPVLVHTVRRSAAGPGECPSHASRPWHASSTKERIGILKQMTAPFKKIQEQSTENYQIAAAEFYGKLREAWERAIEEVLLGDVIQRFRAGVETQRLKKVTVETADYAIIEREMGKCSTWLTGHDSAAALGSSFPTPADTEQDIATLETFVKTIRDRNKKAESAADALVEPPQPKVSDQRSVKIIDLAAPTTQA